MAEVAPTPDAQEHPGPAARRRIMMFVHTLDDRAVCRLTLKVADRLLAMGHEVVLVGATRSQQATLPPVPAGLPIVELGLGSRGTAFGIIRLASVLRALRPDVVFAHLNGPGRAAVLARAISRVRASVVVVEHVHYPTFYGNRRWLRDRLTAVLYPRANRVAGVSTGVVDDLAARFPNIRGRTAVLPPTASALPGAAPPKPPDHPWFQGASRPRLICSVANVVERKGQDKLIEALALLHRELDVRLVLVGRFDDPPFRERLERLTAELGLQESVWLAGYHADASPFIANADVFALASTTEGCPTVLLEAMAYGVPAVSTDCPVGPSFVLDGGRCGLLVPVGDAVTLADAVRQILCDPDLRQGLIGRGRQRAAQFSPEEVAKAYAQLAEDCWREHQRQSASARRTSGRCGGKESRFRR
jgi:glycosyltransferase involved in cell wall biosynthesis